MDIWAEFDYAKMAAEALERVEKLKAGIDRLKKQPTRGMSEKLERAAALQSLEDALFEQEILYRCLRQKARDRDKFWIIKEGHNDRN